MRIKCRSIYTIDQNKQTNVYFIHTPMNNNNLNANQPTSIKSPISSAELSPRSKKLASEPEERVLLQGND